MSNDKHDYIYDLDSDKWSKVALEHEKQFGFYKQLTKLIEELGELTKISAKIKGNDENDIEDTEEQIENFHEEILDVLIMITQFKKMYLNEDKIKNLMRKKYIKACQRVGLIL